jgi:type IV pilus biogenesis protein CpaD/CtpE
MSLLGRAALFAALALPLAGCADDFGRHVAFARPCRAPNGDEVGCANAANLTAMVADPADLTRGRALTPGSAARAAKAVETYESPPEREAAPEPRTETTR